MPLKPRITPDKELWHQGIAQIILKVENLPPAAVAQVRAGINELMSLKLAMQAIVERVAGSSTCGECGGKCCRCGRYHFTAIDLVAYLVTGKELFAPDFAGEGCLFLDGDRCLMPPEYRPFNCITFACEDIEDRFTGEEKDRFYFLERELRLSYRKLQHHFPYRRMGLSVLSFTDNDDD
ncbi:hypothetical protein [Geotalea sp. SG265]|uniref:hypothetical protein n=1 Tax=Geotalea sp. SG265 TaxID=2922867 RepID=UPI001FB02A54|nr:hypothetical protein [Geotalea sp. SG265]